MFVWTVHRLTGLLLVALLGLKMLTALFLMTKGEKPDWALTLHVTPMLDVLLIVAMVFHALYGIRTVIFDLGFRKEKLLFWLTTIGATAISALLLGAYFTRDY